MKTAAAKWIVATLVLVSFVGGSVSAGSEDRIYWGRDAGIAPADPFGADDRAFPNSVAIPHMVPAPQAIAGALLGGDDDDEPEFPIIGPNGKAQLDIVWITTGDVDGWSIAIWCGANAESASAAGSEHVFASPHYRGFRPVIKMTTFGLPGNVPSSEPVLYADDGMTDFKGMKSKAWQTTDALAVYSCFGEWLKKPKQ